MPADIIAGTRRVRYKGCSACLAGRARPHRRSRDTRQKSTNSRTEMDTIPRAQTLNHPGQRAARGPRPCRRDSVELAHMGHTAPRRMDGTGQSGVPQTGIANRKRHILYPNRQYILSDQMQSRVLRPTQRQRLSQDKDTFQARL